MRWVFEDILPRSNFDDLPQIHHGDTMAYPFNGRHVVADEQERELQLLLKVHQNVDDLRLDRYIKRRDRFVANDEPWVERQRAIEMRCR